jgi:hypothetical protein
MLNYLDVHPLNLPARYSNRQACYTKVYITSNIPLEKQYKNVQYDEPATWAAFLRRIHHIVEFTAEGCNSEPSTSAQETKTVQQDLFTELDDHEPLPF